MTCLVRSCNKPVCFRITRLVEGVYYCTYHSTQVQDDAQPRPVQPVSPKRSTTLIICDYLLSREIFMSLVKVSILTTELSVRWSTWSRAESVIGLHRTHWAKWNTLPPHRSRNCGGWPGLGQNCNDDRNQVNCKAIGVQGGGIISVRGVISVPGRVLVYRGLLLYLGGY